MRILLAGQKRFGRDTLALIMRLGHEVAAVACPVLPEPDKLWIAADNARLPVIPSGTLNAGTLPTGVDLIVSAHSHDFIGRKTRNGTRLGAVGYHPSLLPNLRGRDAVRWAIKLRLPVTGGTIYWLDDNVDGGPIAAQEHCFVRPDDDASSLWSRELAPLGLRLFERVLNELQAGTAARQPQDESLASWLPSLDGAPRLRRPDLPQIGSHGVTYRALTGG